MKKILSVLALILVLSSLMSTVSYADYKPLCYDYPNVIFATATMRLSLNAGPGTSRYFRELGTYGTIGEQVHILARAWDPNNGIWWFKVEYPYGTGRTGWTGAKRFDPTTYNLYDIPVEVWY